MAENCTKTFQVAVQIPHNQRLANRVKALVVTAETELPDLAVPEVSLEVYDALLEGASEVAS